MKWLFLFFLIIPNLSFSQVDTCTVYKDLYKTAKILNLKYQEKISKQDSIISDQDFVVSIKQQIIFQKDFMLKNDSLQFDLYSKQIKLLNENLSIYEKERAKEGKWHKRFMPGFIFGIVGTVLLIHSVDYTLP
tara:strand:- start:26676 stop:27074 length:399 start_codon:yes stop_codon:yes gene_type:complete